MRQALNVLFLLCLALPLMAQATGNKRRGAYLRTDVRSRDVSEGYEVKLLQGNGSIPQFVFRKMLIIKLHEVKLYEVVVETVAPNDGIGITPRGAVDYVVLPGEIYEGEHSERTEKKYEGVMKLELFTLNGKSISTDENGVWADGEQSVISAFDEMRNKTVELKFGHKEYGESSLVLSRKLIKRDAPNMPGTENMQPSDLLEALGMDFTQLKQCTGDNIKVQADCKTSAGPGEIVAVTVEVQNNGNRPLSNVIARTFSSARSLDGKMLYFGMLQPGQKRTFFRLLTMPESRGPCYVRLAFWSVCGAMNDSVVNLCINVE